VTTFDLSIHDAPQGKNSHRSFTNDDAPKLLLDLGKYDIAGWDAHSKYVSWADEERIKRHTPDWCLHVAACSRKQLMRLIEAWATAGSGANGPALRIAAAALIGEKFVIRVLEF